MAFEYAINHGHFRITTLHKTNVMRLSDGMFVKACREVSACYPEVEYKEEKLDSFCLHATTNPGRYDVLLTTSLYGAFVSAVCGTMSGGLATVPAAAYGPKAAVFSTVSDYGYSNHCRTEDDCIVVRMPYEREPIVNPTGMIRAAAWMLDHAGMVVAGRRIAGALETAIRQGVRTLDMGGDASCAQFTDAVIDNMECPIPSDGGGGGGDEECCHTPS
ncbi:probable isocitrate dehydrogenase [NAD] subunit alpha, mitochondrial [Rhopalosiphum padi]|uniref:probable isocitrate dehydrogenase [NAD] subunit alpha, mitochondrial n=1 Tax=Rhopalosiphum padi TaxID=40932 RepID=UPI00298D738D|nr:probable isocitrate dehydrogenase [NAD] subunit alpha, mitochondrial [Rhopalosiphum padi]